jgi:regulator of replication initiation timing
MGADLYMSSPRDERELWEKVRDMQEELGRMKKHVADLSKTIDKKNEEIKALQVALRSLKG